jgi:hypothetical protein
MLALLRTLHVLSLAVWLGSVVFFTVSGVLMSRAFEDLGHLADDDKPRSEWFPIPSDFNKPPPDEGLPASLRKEQGSRAFGVAVGAVFPFYFALQTVCAAVAVVTAAGLAWGRGGKLSTLRVVVCVLGLAAVLGGWGLERYVHQLREPRNDLTDAVLTARPGATAEQIEKARQARAVFGKWHGISLLVNFTTLGLALAGTVLAAHLPASRSD